MGMDLIIRKRPMPPDRLVPPFDADPDEWEESRAEDFLDRTDGGVFQFALRARPLVMGVLQAGGALWTSPVEIECADLNLRDGARVPRGPSGQVCDCKFSTNDGWHVTAEEAKYLAEKLTLFLGNPPRLRINDRECDFSANAPSEDERGARRFLLDLAAFFAHAGAKAGFEVW